jgi:hypothetical protein
MFIVESTVVVNFNTFCVACFDRSDIEEKEKKPNINTFVRIFMYSVIDIESFFESREFIFGMLVMISSLTPTCFREIVLSVRLIRCFTGFC